MSYEGIFTSAFKKDLKNLGKKHPKDLGKIVISIETVILIDPFSSDIKQLECFEYYRSRVGKYRIVFDIENENRIIFLALDERSSIYGGRLIRISA